MSKVAKFLMSDSDDAVGPMSPLSERRQKSPDLDIDGVHTNDNTPGVAEKHDLRYETARRGKLATKNLHYENESSGSEKAHDFKVKSDSNFVSMVHENTEAYIQEMKDEIDGKADKDTKPTKPRKKFKAAKKKASVLRLGDDSDTIRWPDSDSDAAFIPLKLITQNKCRKLQSNLNKMEDRDEASASIPHEKKESEGENQSDAEYNISRNVSPGDDTQNVKISKRATPGNHEQKKNNRYQQFSFTGRHFDLESELNVDRDADEVGDWLSRPIGNGISEIDRSVDGDAKSNGSNDTADEIEAIEEQRRRKRRESESNSEESDTGEKEKKRENVAARNAKTRHEQRVFREEKVVKSPTQATRRANVRSITEVLLALKNYKKPTINSSGNNSKKVMEKLVRLFRRTGGEDYFETGDDEDAEQTDHGETRRMMYCVHCEKKVVVALPGAGDTGGLGHDEENIFEHLNSKEHKKALRNFYDVDTYDELLVLKGISVLMSEESSGGDSKGKGDGESKKKTLDAMDSDSSNFSELSDRPRFLGNVPAKEYIQSEDRYRSNPTVLSAVHELYKPYASSECSKQKTKKSKKVEQEPREGTFRTAMVQHYLDLDKSSDNDSDMSKAKRRQHLHDIYGKFSDGDDAAASPATLEIRPKTSTERVVRDANDGDDSEEGPLPVLSNHFLEARERRKKTPRSNNTLDSDLGLQRYSWKSETIVGMPNPEQNDVSNATQVLVENSLDSIGESLFVPSYDKNKSDSEAAVSPVVSPQAAISRDYMEINTIRRQEALRKRLQAEMDMGIRNRKLLVDVSSLQRNQDQYVRYSDVARRAEDHTNTAIQRVTKPTSNNSASPPPHKPQASTKLDANSKYHGNPTLNYCQSPFNPNSPGRANRSPRSPRGKQSNNSVARAARSNLVCQNRSNRSSPSSPRKLEEKNVLRSTSPVLTSRSHEISPVQRDKANDPFVVQSSIATQKLNEIKKNLQKVLNYKGERPAATGNSVDVGQSVFGCDIGGGTIPDTGTPLKAAGATDGLSPYPITPPNTVTKTVVGNSTGKIADAVDDKSQGIITETRVYKEMYDKYVGTGSTATSNRLTVPAHSATMITPHRSTPAASPGIQAKDNALIKTVVTSHNNINIVSEFDASEKTPKTRKPQVDMDGANSVTSARSGYRSAGGVSMSSRRSKNSATSSGKPKSRRVSAARSNAVGNRLYSTPTASTLNKRAQQQLMDARFGDTDYETDFSSVQWPVEDDDNRDRLFEEAVQKKMERDIMLSMMTPKKESNENHLLGEPTKTQSQNDVVQPEITSSTIGTGVQGGASNATTPSGGFLSTKTTARKHATYLNSSSVASTSATPGAVFSEDVKSSAMQSSRRSRSNSHNRLGYNNSKRTPDPLSSRGGVPGASAVRDASHDGPTVEVRKSVSRGGSHIPAQTELYVSLSKAAFEEINQKLAHYETLVKEGKPDEVLQHGKAPVIDDLRRVERPHVVETQRERTESEIIESAVRRAKVEQEKVGIARDERREVNALRKSQQALKARCEAKSAGFESDHKEKKRVASMHIERNQQRRDSGNTARKGRGVTAPRVRPYSKKSLYHTIYGANCYSTSTSNTSSHQSPTDHSNVGRKSKETDNTSISAQTPVSTGWENESASHKPKSTTASKEVTDFENSSAVSSNLQKRSKSNVGSKKQHEAGDAYRKRERPQYRTNSAQKNLHGAHRDDENARARAEKFQKPVKSGQVPVYDHRWDESNDDSEFPRDNKHTRVESHQNIDSKKPNNPGGKLILRHENYATEQKDSRSISLLKRAFIPSKGNQAKVAILNSGITNPVTPVKTPLAELNEDLQSLVERNVAIAWAKREQQERQDSRRDQEDLDVKAATDPYADKKISRVAAEIIEEMKSGNVAGVGPKLEMKIVAQHTGNTGLAGLSLPTAGTRNAYINTSYGGSGIVGDLLSQQATNTIGPGISLKFNDGLMSNKVKKVVPKITKVGGTHRSKSSGGNHTGKAGSSGDGVVEQRQTHIAASHENRMQQPQHRGMTNVPVQNQTYYQFFPKTRPGSRH